jgi:hypothetical protein
MFLLLAFLSVGSLSINAQNAPLQKMRVEDRVKRIIVRMTTGLILSGQQAKDMSPVYTTFYTEMDAITA